MGGVSMARCSAPTGGGGNDAPAGDGCGALSE